jgi:hypothetical protein
VSAISTVGGGRALRTVRRIPALGGAGILAASYLFVSAVSHADRAGYRTLSAFSVLVTALRGSGLFIARAAEGVLVVTSLPFLGIVAALTLFLLRRYRARTWRHDAALALLAPLLATTAIFVLRGDLAPASLAGVLTGACLLVCGGREPRREPSPILVLVPLALGSVLRFYALAQVPNGYAEHAVVHHVDLSLPYLEVLSTSLGALQLGPLLATAANALLREQFGASSLVAAVGFGLFGVSLTVTRLLSAALGTLTVYVAYRLGRALDGVRLGLAFSFLLAVSPWHVTISRYGDQEHVLSPLQLLLSLFFLVTAVNGGRLRDWLLAALCTAAAWTIYAANLVVPVIAGGVLLLRVCIDRRLAVRNWGGALAGLVLFALLSYAPLQQLFPRGVIQWNGRTGSPSSTSLLSDLPTRLQMLGAEVDQLFRHADDPWFSTPGGGLGVLQSVLLLPGLLLAATALRQQHHRDLALIALVGLPLGALPAVLAADQSFRRLMPVTTLVALVSAFALVRLYEAVRSAGIPRQVGTAIACCAAVAVGATGTFGYFDRAFIETESAGAAQFRALGATVSDLVGSEPLLVVVPRRDNLTDTHRYIKLMAYDALLDAQRHGIARDALYLVTTCEDVAGTADSPPARARPPVLVVHVAVLEPGPPCGRELLARVTAQYPQSTIIVAEPPAPEPTVGRL